MQVIRAHLLRPSKLDVQVEISSRPPTEKGFVPIAKRWVSERTPDCRQAGLDGLISSGACQKTMNTQQKVPKP